jgi:hypothetical protein
MIASGIVVLLVVRLGQNAVLDGGILPDARSAVE